MILVVALVNLVKFALVCPITEMILSSASQITITFRLSKFDIFLSIRISEISLEPFIPNGMILSPLFHFLKSSGSLTNLLSK